MYKILSTVRQHLHSESARSNDPSVITNGLSDNIQQIAASINGLVVVAKQSQHTQEMQMLLVCRKELEDTIKYLKGSAMELEIKSLNEAGTKKQLLENAVLKKKKDLHAKQKELAEMIQSFDQCNKEGMPSAKNNSMPCFVNLAWDSDEDMDN